MIVLPVYRARLFSLGCFVLAAVVPFLLWSDVMAGIAQEFRFNLHYFVAQASPWLLLAAGLAFMVPVAMSAGADPESRWYPRGRNAYAGWGITLYLLGFVLATQVSMLWELST